MRAALLSVLCFACFFCVSIEVCAQSSSELTALFKSKNYDRSLELAKKMLVGNQNNLLALEVAAKSCASLDDNHGAVFYMERYVALKPVPFQLYFLALYLSRCKEYEKSSEAINKCLARDPNFGPAYLFRADLVKRTEGVSAKYKSDVSLASKCKFEDSGFQKDLALARKIAGFPPI